MLFGLALIYGATGATQFDVIAESLAAGELRGPLPSSIALSAGLALAMVGFGFKLTLAPFQMYAPDVYAGAPTPVAGLIATGSKVATMAILFQLLSVIAGWADRPDALYWGLYAMTVASIVVGGVGAIVQANFKRLMAYSGVSHGGYMMLALVPALRDPSLLDDSRRAIAYYLIAYVLMTATAFGVAASLGSEGDGKLDRFSGLGRRSPLLAGALAISLLSLTGVPPTVGFFGKVYLFSIPIAAGDYLLAVLGVLASVASAYYYLRAIVRMYMEEPHRDRREPPRVEIFNAFAVAVGSAGVLLVALWPVMDSWVD
jgi:NADH-quinone oxidoreductase subunit N